MTKAKKENRFWSRISIVILMFAILFGIPIVVNAQKFLLEFNSYNWGVKFFYVCITIALGLFVEWYIVDIRPKILR